MFELPEFVILAQQINETISGLAIRSGQPGNCPHKFVWYNQTPGGLWAMPAISVRPARCSAGSQKQGREQI